MLLRRERTLFSLDAAIKVARIMRRAGLRSAIPLWYSNGCVIEATYLDKYGHRHYVAPGNYRGVKRVILRYKREMAS